MWISLFAVSTAIAIGFGVAAFLMRDINTIADSMCDGAERRLRNMADMMNRLGLDAAMVAKNDSLNISSAYRACQLCPTGEVCCDWLARAPKSLKRAPAFCPNAECFAQAKGIKS